MVPENEQDYLGKMAEFVQTGGNDPLKTWQFVKKELQVPFTNDPIKASAEAAAAEIPTSGGPAGAAVTYLKIQNKTAYVVLEMDINGWAGVSVSIAKIHPLVEKTLLQFPEISKVVFGYAPGDNANNI